MGSAKGWAASLAFHSNIKKSIANFMSKKNTFSLGVCNGCQLMCSLGLVGKLSFKYSVCFKFTYLDVYVFILGEINENNLLNIDNPPIVMCHNKSGRYESRFSTVKINSSKAIMFKDMDESILGVWIAHAEGNLYVHNFVFI